MENKENSTNEKSTLRKGWDYVKPTIKTVIEVGVVSVITAAAACEYFIRKNFVEETEEEKKDSE